MDRSARTIFGHIIEYVGLTEYRRLVIVLGIPVLFAVLLWEQNVIGTVVVFLGLGLATVLYTRPTAQKTIAASAYATGVLMIGLLLLELYWNWAQAGTASQAAIATEGLWQVVAGTLLIGFGLWLRQIEFQHGHHERSLS
jgi:protein-S-isoprenylcysteine O-methyltransferase Ste14